MRLWARLEVNMYLVLESIRSLKLAAKAPENQWLEDDFPLGVPIIRGDWKRPCFGGLKPQNRGTVSIYIYI